MNIEQSHEQTYSNHATVWRLLPWHITGTLSADEQQLVARHTAVCLVCHKELALQRTLCNTVRDAELDDVMMTTSFDRLSARIAAAAGPGPSAAAGIAARLVSRANRWLGKPVQAYAAAATLVLAVGAGFSVFNDSQLPVNNTFRTLSNSTTELPTTANLRIIFAETLSTSERAAILNQSGLTAISGPDARGMYYVKSASQSPAATAAALMQLRANDQIVFAESVLATPGNQ